ncbi:MAG TPA: KTSC domain-containing protein [Sphingomicrobium sp.]|nr:KTSC domain-containing protein [Sphingomicrobium sp.]
MPSTVIRRFDYRPESRELEILFTTGRRYIYSDVTEETVRDFRAAFAKGSYFNRQIRDRYPCREVDPVP